jgi:uncharacterized protein YjiS (DUF1127 family)
MTNHAMTTPTEASSLGASSFGVMGREAAASLLKLYRAFLAWRLTRQDERYLLEMSDQHLADIGIARSDILEVLRGERRR